MATKVLKTHRQPLRSTGELYAFREDIRTLLTLRHKHDDSSLRIADLVKEVFAGLQPQYKAIHADPLEKAMRTTIKSWLRSTKIHGDSPFIWVPARDAGDGKIIPSSSYWRRLKVLDASELSWLIAYGEDRVSDWDHFTTRFRARRDKLLQQQARTPTEAAGVSSKR